MYRIAIIDDNIEFLSMIENLVQEYYKKKDIPVAISAYEKSELLFYDIKDGIYFDLYLMDIEMPKLNGMIIAREIRQKSKDAFIIFLTSHLKYSIDAYELNIYRYIPKNMIKDKLAKALSEVSKELEIDKNKAYIICTKSRLEKILYRNILYIYKDGKNSIIMCDAGNYRVRKNLKEVYEELEVGYFMFIDRGYIVNLMHIMRLSSNEVVLSNGEMLFVSRPHMNDVKLKITSFWGKCL